MTKGLIAACVLSVVTVLIAGCGASSKQFTKDCHTENNGLPMSQIDMLYLGCTEHKDQSALQTLKENCPKAVKKHID